MPQLLPATRRTCERPQSARAGRRCAAVGPGVRASVRLPGPRR
ncbi:hypothetical protein UO65_1571 [Actinokineospora spheciospongiae]|uniref:Uncharacterized protein n=1 Tax=Actinokineospora spheciospongiae TaxID=909613 RepID=W7J202_9PSEU|nr:hypothetical protein UO65_1571 [Actinokineospora spheciospongiae]